MYKRLFLFILLLIPFFAIASDENEPRYKLGEHVIVSVSGDEAIVTGENGYSSAKGWTLKIVLLESKIKIPRIHENELKSLK